MSPLSRRRRRCSQRLGSVLGGGNDGGGGRSWLLRSRAKMCLVGDGRSWRGGGGGSKSTAKRVRCRIGEERRQRLNTAGGEEEARVRARAWRRRGNDGGPMAARLEGAAATTHGGRERAKKNKEG